MGGAYDDQFATARARGIAEARMVHVGGGASGKNRGISDPRPGFRESPAERVIKSVMELAQATARRSMRSSYTVASCVPKNGAEDARDSARRAADVNGGMTFFGARSKTYMTHAACAVVRQAAQRRKSACLRPGRCCQTHHALCCHVRRRNMRWHRKQRAGRGATGIAVGS